MTISFLLLLFPVPQSSCWIWAHPQVPHLGASSYQRGPRRRLPPGRSHLCGGGEQIWPPPSQIQVLWCGFHTSPRASHCHTSSGPLEVWISISLCHPSPSLPGARHLDRDTVKTHSSPQIGAFNLGDKQHHPVTLPRVRVYSTGSQPVEVEAAVDVTEQTATSAERWLCCIFSGCTLLECLSFVFFSLTFV